MKSYYWALLTMVTWGCVPLIEKIGLLKIPVWAGLFYRSLGVIAGLIILICFKVDEIKNAVNHIPSGWYYLAVGGFMASILGQIFFYNALKTGEVSSVAPVSGAYPLISFLLGVLILGEKITLTKIGGIIFVLIGIMLLR